MFPTRKKLSAPAVARQLGVAHNKVVAWIRSGELRAINLARRPDGRPRYAIDVDDLRAFEAARRVVPDGGLSTTQRLRRRAQQGVKQFV